MVDWNEKCLDFMRSTSTEESRPSQKDYRSTMIANRTNEIDSRDFRPIDADLACFRYLEWYENPDNEKAWPEVESLPLARSY